MPSKRLIVKGELALFRNSERTSTESRIKYKMGSNTLKLFRTFLDRELKKLIHFMFKSFVYFCLENHKNFLVNHATKNSLN